MPDKKEVKVETKLYNLERANETLKAENAQLRQRVKSLTKKLDRTRRFRSQAEEELKNAVIENKQFKALEEAARKRLDEEASDNDVGATETTSGSSGSQGQKNNAGGLGENETPTVSETKDNAEETRPAEGQQEQAGESYED